MVEYGKIVDGDNVGTCDGIVKIICGNKFKEVIITANGDENDAFLSLNDCLKLVDYDNDNDLSAIVIIEDWTHGIIYRYGSYTEKTWEIHGETKGFV